MRRERDGRRPRHLQEGDGATRPHASRRGADDVDGIGHERQDEAAHGRIEGPLVRHVGDVRSLNRTFRRPASIVRARARAIEARRAPRRSRPSPPSGQQHRDVADAEPRSRTRSPRRCPPRETVARSGSEELRLADQAFMFRIGVAERVDGIRPSVVTPPAPACAARAGSRWRTHARNRGAPRARGRDRRAPPRRAGRRPRRPSRRVAPYGPPTASARGGRARSRRRPGTRSRRARSGCRAPRRDDLPLRVRQQQERQPDLLAHRVRALRRSTESAATTAPSARTRRRLAVLRQLAEAERSPVPAKEGSRRSVPGATATRAYAAPRSSRAVRSRARDRRCPASSDDLQEPGRP